MLLHCLVGERLKVRETRAMGIKKSVRVRDRAVGTEQTEGGVESEGGWRSQRSGSH